MSTKIDRVWIDDTAVYIRTDAGEIFSEKFADYQRLRNATAKQRAAFTCNNIGIRWDELDEDLSFEGFMQGDKDGDKPALYHVFKNNPELNVSAVARRLGIPQSLMASYLCGIKKPSRARLREIETAIRAIGENLRRIQIQNA
jgi:hypothetical protein